MGFARKGQQLKADMWADGKKDSQQAGRRVRGSLARRPQDIQAMAVTKVIKIGS